MIAPLGKMGQAAIPIWRFRAEMQTGPDGPLCWRTLAVLGQRVEFYALRVLLKDSFSLMRADLPERSRR